MQIRVEEEPPASRPANPFGQAGVSVESVAALDGWRGRWLDDGRIERRRRICPNSDECYYIRLILKLLFRRKVVCLEVRVVIQYCCDHHFRSPPTESKLTQRAKDILGSFQRRGRFGAGARDLNKIIECYLAWLVPEPILDLVQH